MNATSKSTEPQIRSTVAKERGRTYKAYQLTRYVNGRRVRQRFKSLDEAVGEKSRVSVQLANAEGEIRAVNTRLSKEQVIAVEIAINRLGAAR